MSTPLTPVATVPPSTYPLIAPGDGVTSANFAQTAQPIINAIAWLRGKLPGANPSSAPIDLVIPTALGMTRATSVQWVRKAVTIFTDPDVLWQQTVATQDAVIFSLDSCLRQGMVISAFSCDFLGASGHAGTLPGQMPTVQLFKIARGIGTIVQPRTLVDSIVDPTATAAAYELIHTISRTLGSPETVDLSAYRYLLYVYGEGNTNAQVGSVIISARLSVSG